MNQPEYTKTSSIPPLIWEELSQLEALSHQITIVTEEMIRKAMASREN